ncbi:MAG: dockerin type I repeat-containing protein [Ruminococcus sp.]|nr:dockerin type I repeat-containing protein [Ruminococcus sp.]
MKKIICSMLAVVLLISTLSITAFASEEVKKTGVYYSMSGYDVTVLPSASVLDAENELKVKAAYVAQSSLQMTTDDVEVDYYGSLSNGDLLVAPSFWGVATNPKTYMVIDSYIYVIDTNSKEVMLFADNKLYRLYEAYISAVIDDELLSEIASKLNLSVYPTPVYEIDKELVDELNDLMDIYYVRHSTVGTQKPYSQETFARENAAYQLAENVIANKSATNEDYHNAIDRLSYALNNTCIDKGYAKQTYVLSLKEQNDNGFYGEADWNDYVEKRNALRDSFKTNDEKTISDAYFELYDSFTNMTSKYTIAGDVNNDGVVNIDDVTLIQKYVSDTTSFTGVQVELASRDCGKYQYADYGYVPKITVDDVTALQKVIAVIDSNTTQPVVRYGRVTTDCYNIEFNSKICLGWFFMDSRYDEVNAKVKELEAEGII